MKIVLTLEISLITQVTLMHGNLQYRNINTTKWQSLTFRH